MKFYVFNAKKALFFTAIAIAVIFALFLTVQICSLAKVIETGIYGENVENDDLVIVIDAGHGGIDPGAISAKGDYEKDLNLKISLLIGEELEIKGYNVVYTRRDDKLLLGPGEDIKGIRKISDLKNRCKIANQYKKSIFVSIHMNSFGDAKYSGLQVYFSDNNSDSRILAQKIQSSVKEKVQNDNKRAIKNGRNIYVLKNCNNVGVLIECGFLTNSEESAKLSEKEYQKRLSFSVVCGIIEYIEGVSSTAIG